MRLWNSSPPSDAYIRWWTGSALVQIMACRWSAPSHYMNQCRSIAVWTLWNKLQWNFKRNSYIFIQENAFENVAREKVAILSQPQCGKPEELVQYHGCWYHPLFPSATILITWNGNVLAFLEGESKKTYNVSRWRNYVPWNNFSTWFFNYDPKFCFDIVYSNLKWHDNVTAIQCRWKNFMVHHNHESYVWWA